MRCCVFLEYLVLDGNDSRFRKETLKLFRVRFQSLPRIRTSVRTENLEFYPDVGRHVLVRENASSIGAYRSSIYDGID